MIWTIIYVHVHIILDFPITYRNALLMNLNVVFSLFKVMKIPTPKGRALMQIYRVVPITNRGNYITV